MPQSPTRISAAEYFRIPDNIQTRVESAGSIPTLTASDANTSSPYASFTNDSGARYAQYLDEGVLRATPTPRRRSNPVPPTSILNYSANIFDYVEPPLAGDNSRIFGIEIEIQAGRDWSSSELAETFALKCHEGADGVYFIMKGDSSIGGPNGGFEVVTKPMSLAEHGEFWPRALAWNPSPEKFKTWLAQGLTCGMHVHVNRASLSVTAIRRANMFINSHIMQGALAHIAGRNPNYYCRPIIKTPTAPVRDEGHDMRYQAINLINERTVEYRIFRSTLNPNRIGANIQFVDASLEFAEHVGNRNQLTPDKFFSYVTENEAKYPLLLKLMQNIPAGLINIKPSQLERIKEHNA